MLKEYYVIQELLECEQGYYVIASKDEKQYILYFESIEEYQNGTIKKVEEL